MVETVFKKNFHEHLHFVFRENLAKSSSIFILFLNFWFFVKLLTLFFLAKSLQNFAFPRNLFFHEILKFFGKCSLRFSKKSLRKFQAKYCMGKWTPFTKRTVHCENLFWVFHQKTIYKPLRLGWGEGATQTLGVRSLKKIMCFPLQIKWRYTHYSNDK